MKGDDEATLSACRRCEQLVAARAACPFCGDIDIVLHEEVAAPGLPSTWTYELCPRHTVGPLRLAVAGFASADEALAEAHDSIRVAVADLRRERDGIASS